MKISKTISKISAFVLATSLFFGIPQEIFPNISECFTNVSVLVNAEDEIAINDVNFPDAVFREYVQSNFDKDSNGILSSSEISAVRSIDVQNEVISSLKGIEYFSALTDLNCNTNKLTSLDVSKNTALTYLDCDTNKLTSLDVSNNNALTELYFRNNQLTSLDVSKNTALEILYCGNNQLTSLDVSKNTALIFLGCYNNQLTSLDVSKNTALKVLECFDNQLTSLDVSKNTALTRLNCHANQLTSLDVSKNTALIWLYCSDNQLTSLDVSKNTALTELHCENNQLTSLDVSKNTALPYFRCNNNTYTINTGVSSEYKDVYKFDLSLLPGFDATKASDWTGATYNSSDNTLSDFTSDTVTYVYDCGRNYEETFTLKFNFDENNVPQTCKHDYANRETNASFSIELPEYCWAIEGTEITVSNDSISNNFTLSSVNKIHILSEDGSEKVLSSNLISDLVEIDGNKIKIISDELPDDVILIFNVSYSSSVENIKKDTFSANFFDDDIIELDSVYNDAYENGLKISATENKKHKVYCSNDCGAYIEKNCTFTNGVCICGNTEKESVSLKAPGNNITKGLSTDVTFEYSDDLFLGNATEYNYELSKLSSIMADAAYEPDDINANLNALHFENISDMGSYKKLKSLTKEDCDYVGYTFATKEFNDYILVAVMIKGTSKNMEWESNFNLGLGNRHQGFQIANERLLSDLEEYLKDRNISPSKTKFWITGHSRGAGVGNLVAADITDGKLKINEASVLFNKTNIYAYLYAPPAGVNGLSDNDTQHDNIFNFINPQDFVPRVPLQAWDYGRYGKLLIFPNRITKNGHVSNIYELPFYEKYENLFGVSPKNFLFENEFETVHIINYLYIHCKDIYQYYGVDFYPNGDFSVSKKSWYDYFFNHVAPATRVDINFDGAINVLLPLLDYGELYDPVTRYLLDGSIYFLDGLIGSKDFTYAHAPESYIVWAYTCDQLSDFQSELFLKELIIACPVDIEVYDKNGDLVGRVVDNVIDEEVTNISIFVDEETSSKTIYTYEDEVYTIKAIGYDCGTMDYSIRLFDMMELSDLDNRSVEKIEITPNTVVSTDSELTDVMEVIATTISDDGEEQVIKYNVDNDNNVTITKSGTTLYSIKATSGNGGSISSDGASVLSEGSDKTYTISANSGYFVSDVKVDGVSVGAINTYTFENISENHTIEAFFKLRSNGSSSSSSKNDKKYDILNGENQEWRNREKGIEIVIDADYNDFIRVEVDGATIDKSMYDVKKGSTIISLKSEYLKTLKEGSHTIKIIFKSGTASTNIFISSNGDLAAGEPIIINENVV